ncbi:RCC1-like G exchanging factor-like protein [Xenia sp. Carnegie-2017]|uniref:RCC1-like G exchanging factor-like protein n=1 Tax=Xenia sp. Carnegie-2017 TaxID=2897299 RepID=UPI001F04E85D|nr:RCC1-like G exchanging factor-like protein [Xenia sp. Carnegie-2017]
MLSRLSNAPLNLQKLFPRNVVKLKNYCKITKNTGHLDSTAEIQILSQLNKPFVDNNCTHLAGGYGFSVFCSGKTLNVIGLNTKSQLGIPSNHSSVVDHITRVDLSLKKDSKILGISSGRLHTIISTTEGLFAAGCNTLGQCGLNLEKEIEHFTKIECPIINSVKQVSCGLDHTLVLTEDNQILSTGWGADGQTGLGQTMEQHSLAQVQFPSNVRINKIATKIDSCLALSDEGLVYSWGNSEYNQVGFATNDRKINIPTLIPTLKDVVDIAIGNTIGVALTAEGDVLIWGYGLLGRNDQPLLSKKPKKLTFLPEKRFVAVDCGLNYNVLFTEERELYFWGKCGTMLSRFPQKIASNILKFCCGVNHLTIIIDEDY